MSTRRLSSFEKRTAGYLALPNAVTEDKRLTFKALGVLVYLLSRPDDWRPNYRQLIQTHVDGEVAVRSALSELEAAGYYSRERIQHPDGTWGWKTTVSETPSLGSPSLGNPGMDGPGSTNDGEPMTEYPTGEESDDSPPARPPAKPRARDEVWDTLTEIFGPAQTPGERGRRGKTVKELKEVGATPEMIQYAWKRWGSIFPRTNCTERALVNHWSKLTHRHAEVSASDREWDAAQERARKRRNGEL